MSSSSIVLPLSLSLASTFSRPSPLHYFCRSPLHSLHSDEDVQVEESLAKLIASMSSVMSQFVDFDEVEAERGRGKAILLKNAAAVTKANAARTARVTEELAVQKTKLASPGNLWSPSQSGGGGGVEMTKTSSS